MESVSGLGATHLAATMATYGHVLRLHQEALNALNVYPVPDGDTGTNMALTLEFVVSELAGLEGLENLESGPPAPIGPGTGRGGGAAPAPWL
jgi:dihydroxyacetone kinase-like predicted kinase